MGVSVGLFGFALILLNVVMDSLGASSGVPPGKPTGLSFAKPLESSADHGVIATIKWRAPLSNSTLSFYVRYQEDKASDPLQKRVTSNSAFLYLKPNTKYTIKVMALDEAFRQGPWSNDFIVQTGDSVPTKAPDNVTAISRDASSILVTWQAIPKKYHNGVLLGYIVFFRRRGSKKWKRQSISSAEKHSYTINGLLPRVNYIVAVAGYTKTGTGKKSIDVSVDRSLSTPKPKSTPTPTPTQPTTTSRNKKRTFIIVLSTKKMTTPKTVANNISKPFGSTTETKYSMEVHRETLTNPTEAIAAPPDAQANKDVTESDNSSLELVYKFIAPCAIGGLILVVLIICIMWHQRRLKTKRKHQQSIAAAMCLQTLRENKSPARKDTNCEVTRGEGSIRYAPPTKSYSTSSQGCPHNGVNITSNQLAQSNECRSSLGVITETDSSGKRESREACRPEELTNLDASRRRNYSEVSVGNSDKIEKERYVKRGDKSRIYSEPFKIQATPSSPAKSTTSEAKYENMQHLYEFLDAKDDKGNPLYMNIDGFGDKSEGEDLYEEIPADQPQSPSEEQPLLNTRSSCEEEKTK